MSAPRSPSLAVVVTALGGVLAAGTVLGEPLQLRPAEILQAGGQVLDPGDQAIPCVVDWNADGRKDLLVGYRPADKIALYLNTGTDEEAVFSGLVNLQAGGRDIAHPSSACGAPAPWVADYDGDGRRDLWVGTGVEGYVYVYRNTNTVAEPVLAPGIQLKIQGAPLDVGERATPYVQDWDDDGLNDLLCGAADGYVYLFRNTGSVSTPVYARSEQIQAGGTPLNLGIRSAVRLIDWDGDGIKDVVGSGSHPTAWCRNMGSNQAPQFGLPQTLLVPAAGRGLIPLDTGYRMRLEAMDWNNDGVTDLLIGNYDGRVLLFRGYHFVILGLQPQGDGAIQLEWAGAASLSYSVLGGSTPDAVTNVIATNVVAPGNLAIWVGPGTSDRLFLRVRLDR